MRIDTATGRSLPAGHRDQGTTLIEMLVVVLILAILTSAVVIAVSGMRTEAAGAGCDADRRQLHLAAEAFAAQIGSEIPATGDGHDRYERTLVTVGLLRAPSSHHDLGADGVVTTQEGSPC